MNQFDDFNKNFNDMSKKVGRIQCAGIIVWVISFVFSIALAGAIIWVAWHFISKYW